MSIPERALQRLRDVKTAIQREGPSATLRRARDHFFQSAEFVLYRWNQGETVPAVAWEDGYTWQPGTVELLERERSQRSDLPREFFVDRTHGSRHFYVIYRGEDPAHIHWVFRKGEYSRFFSLSDRAAEINYIYTFPGHRGRALLKRGIAATLAAMSSEGFLRVCTAVTTTNVNCIRGLQNSGLREFARSRTRFSFVRKEPL